MVLVSKQGQEHVHMMLKTLAGHSLSKKVAPLPQPNGGHGQVVRKHAIVVSIQELEHVLTMNQTQAMSQKLSRKLATLKNAVMTLGQHGVTGIHAPIVVPVRIKNNVHGVNLSKLRVHKKVNRFKPSMKRRIVVGQAIGVPVSSKRGFFIKDNYLNRKILWQRSCKYDHKLSKWM